MRMRALSQIEQETKNNLIYGVHITPTSTGSLSFLLLPSVSVFFAINYGMPKISLCLPYKFSLAIYLDGTYLLGLGDNIDGRPLGRGDGRALAHDHIDCGPLGPPAQPRRRPRARQQRLLRLPRARPRQSPAAARRELTTIAIMVWSPLAHTKKAKPVTCLYACIKAQEK